MNQNPSELYGNANSGKLYFFHDVWGYAISIRTTGTKNPFK